jgi:hypothetical protein
MEKIMSSRSRKYASPSKIRQKTKPENPVRVSWAIGGRNPSTCISSLFPITKLMRRYVPHFSLLKKEAADSPSAVSKPAPLRNQGVNW